MTQPAEIKHQEEVIHKLKDCLNREKIYPPWQESREKDS